MTIRCTHRPVKAMRVASRTLPDPATTEGDWYADLLWFDRRKCLLLTPCGARSSRSSSPTSAPRTCATSASCSRATPRWRYDEELPPDALGELTAPAVLARTASRRVLGVMTDDAYQCEKAVFESGGRAQADVLELNRGLRRTLHSCDGGYTTPLDAVRAPLRD